MKRALFFTAILAGLFTSSASAQVVETDHGPVEFVGLRSFTPEALVDTLRVLDPDSHIGACAATLRQQLGFADAAVIGYPAGDKLHLVITVIEPADSSRVRYRSLASNDTSGAVAEWQAALKIVTEQPWLLQVAVRTYGYILDGQAGSARKVLADWWGLAPEQIEPLWRLLQEHTGDADRERALQALAESNDFRSRVLAAAFLANFSDADLVWWRLVDALRDPDARVSEAAMSTLHMLTQHRQREVDWRPAAVSLRHILNGTNLFAYFPTLDLLTQTGLSPALQQDLLNDGSRDLLLANLRAEQMQVQEHVQGFLAALSGQQYEHTGDWARWLEEQRLEQ